MISPTITIRGFKIYKGLLDAGAQVSVMQDLRAVARVAPPLSYDTPHGKSMSVLMTSAGEYGWHSDATGYRYLTRHPNGAAWPDIPAALLTLWEQVSEVQKMPESCLINFYGEKAHLGMHQDRGEAGFQWPVVSLSLGDDGLFRMGSEARGGATDTVWLSSGDVVVMGGAARLAHHGVDKIRFGSSGLLPKGGRVNVTLRVVR